MNTKQTEALKLALEALEPAWELAEWYVDELRNKAITAIRAALASKSEALMSVPDGAHAPKVREQPAQVDPCIDGSCSCCWTHLDEQPAQQQDIPDLIAGTLGVSRGTAYDMMSEALAEAQQQEPVRVPVTDNTYNYAKSLAEAIFKQHFASDEHYSSGRIVWGVNDTVIGILTQIDNMVADMVRKPAQQQEPVAWRYNGNLHEFDPSDWATGPVTPLYTSPPNVPMARASKPLTDEEIEQCMKQAYATVQGRNLEHAFARAIEAKLKEKNGF